eukprot:TRINITY_DN1931_c0_g2_i2.p3 TRINITY_DN1931_c0_g2~~TRINITY_DN1931_c0_g2_i2.p3  ORF type:complete len:108 (-),score=28.17 TRINITY_DN1931_c0_g2_i2:384-707(-)
MACRNNAKKQKAKRNQDNMRKFRKRGTSKKKIVRGKRQQTAREKEADFMAKLYQVREFMNLTCGSSLVLSQQTAREHEADLMASCTRLTSTAVHAHDVSVPSLDACR